jgi:uncharacterized protein (UPF0332 family)
LRGKLRPPKRPCTSKKLHSADLLLEKGFIDDAVSRAYYAVFHAIVGLLRLKKATLDEHKHAYIMTQFRVQFIDTKEFPPEIYYKIQQIKQLREQADYSVVVKVDKDKATRLLADAKEIVVLLVKFLDTSRKT